jgi:hypothetical protein
VKRKQYLVNWPYSMKCDRQDILTD